jgi:hypothetical protein
MTRLPYTEQSIIKSRLQFPYNGKFVLKHSYYPVISKKGMLFSDINLINFQYFFFILSSPFFNPYLCVFPLILYLQFRFIEIYCRLTDN